MFGLSEVICAGITAFNDAINICMVEDKNMKS